MGLNFGFNVRNAFFDFFQHGPVSISYYKLIIISEKKLRIFLDEGKTYPETKFQLFIRKNDFGFGRPTSISSRSTRDCTRNYIQNYVKKEYLKKIVLFISTVL